jgi:hypothetical protein
MMGRIASGASKKPDLLTIPEITGGPKATLDKSTLG